MIIDYLQIVKEQFSETGKRPKYRCGSDRDLDVEWLFSFVDRFFRLLKVFFVVLPYNTICE